MFPLCNVQDATIVNDAVTERRSVVSSWEWIIVGVDYPRCLFVGAEQSRAEQSGAEQSKAKQSKAKQSKAKQKFKEK
jgi:hypothetical protein